MACSSCHIKEGTVSAYAVATCEKSYAEELVAADKIAIKILQSVKAGKLWVLGVSSSGEIMPQHKCGEKGSTLLCWMCWKKEIRNHRRAYPGCAGATTVRCICFST